LKKHAIICRGITNPASSQPTANTVTASNIHQCTRLLTAITSELQCRFDNFPNSSLDYDVNNAILANLTHPYFKLRWLFAQLSHQPDRLHGMLIQLQKTV